MNSLVKKLRSTNALHGVALSCALILLSSCNLFAADDDGLGTATSGAISGYQTGVTVHHIQMISGNQQVGFNGGTLPQPIIVKAVDAFGAAVPSLGMMVQVLQGGGSVDSSVLTTDASGQVYVNWTLGPAAQANSLTVSGLTTMVGSPSLVTATASAYYDSTQPAHITISPGSNNQTGAHNTLLANPLSVVVTDGNGNVKANVRVDWTVTGGQGTLGASSTGTNSSGVATNTYTLGVPGVQAINAVVHGFPSIKLTFVATSTTSPFTQIWNFLSGTTSSYSLGSNIDFSSSNVCELTPSNNFDQTSADFAQGSGTGVVFGTLSDGSSTGLKLGSNSGCDGTLTNCFEFNSSWTPQYSRLVGYWKLNSDFSDSSGNNHTGSSIGDASFTTTNVKVGTGAANFATTNAHGSDLGQIMPATYTKMAWVKINADGGTNIISGGSNTQHAFWFNGCGSLKLSGGHNGTWGSVCDPNPMTLNTWNHVAITYDSSSLVMNLYRNGVLVSTANGVANFSGNSDVRIGQYDGGSQINGYIDDAAIWNTPLSANEIKTIFQHQSPIHAGVFLSRSFDALAPQTWPDLAWVSSKTTEQRMTAFDYASLYPTALMTNNTALWHFDETSGSTAVDSSSNHFNGTIGGTAALGGSGIIGRGFTTTTAGAYLDLGTVNPVIDSHFSVSVWFNGSSSSTGYAITKGNDATGNSWGMVVSGVTGGIQMGFMTFPNGSNVIWSFSPTLSANVWHHAVGVLDGNNKYLYIDGIMVSQTTMGGNIASNGNPLWIGGQNRSGGYNYFLTNTSIDEMGVWSRALTDLEVRQLYQMSGSHISYQMRTCATANCSDPADLWKGPDGTLASAYSEAKGVNTGIATAPTTTYTFPTPSPSPAQKRYFQYRAILETASTVGSGLFPELQTVRAGGVHYDPSSPSVVGSLGTNYYSVNAFSDLPNSSSTCAAGITYNLGVGSSPGTANWYYWNGSVGSDCSTAGSGAWCTSSLGSLSSNTSAVINSHALTFPVSSPVGKIYFKAFLNSNGQSTGGCQLSRVQLDGQL